MRYDSLTNRQFPILSDAALAALSRDYSFSHWGKTAGGDTVVRFCTGWATRDAHLEALLKDIAVL